MKKNNKYLPIRDEYIAKAIAFLTDERFMVFDDLTDKDKKIFSFPNTEKVRRARFELNELKNKLNERD